MSTTSRFAEVANLAGDPARAAMLHALMDGRALTATELAAVAGVTPQTASGHLARMRSAGFLTLNKQGRHRYYKLASASVAHMMEGIMQLASSLEPPCKRILTGPRDQALRTARTCYDHLAGWLGVAISDALITAGHAEIDEEAGVITASGLTFLANLGINFDLKPGARRTGRVLCRPCLDWSERRPHLAGKVGAALCAHSFQHGWIRRIEGTRAVTVTRKGEGALRDMFGIELDHRRSQ